MHAYAHCTVLYCTVHKLHALRATRGFFFFFKVQPSKVSFTDKIEERKKKKKEN